MNRVELRLADVAVSDIQEQADWYEQRSGHALARRWENEVTAALIRIEKNPRSGAKCGFRADELQGIRRIQSPDSPDTWSSIALKRRKSGFSESFTAPATSRACFEAHVMLNEVKYSHD